MSAHEPAFPLNELSRDSGHIVDQHFGMTLRDYFAAKAMHAIYMRFGGSASAGNDFDGCLTHSAEDAYAMADAMLKARTS